MSEGAFHFHNAADRPPVVIFGTGGSGTRVVARIVRHAGWFLGEKLNGADDSLEIAAFLESRTNWYLAQVQWIAAVLRGGDVPTPTSENWDVVVGEFCQAITLHRAAMGGDKWGWKTPRSIFWLPLLHQQFPGIAAIHVIRDGRDMAYSTNQNQLMKHGRHVLSADETMLPTSLQSLILWAQVNLSALLFGQKYFQDNYLQVRFEDLCLDPEGTVDRIFAFLGCNGVIAGDRHAALAEITRPESLGRWRSRSPEEIACLAESGRAALSKFGYE